MNNENIIKRGTSYLVKQEHGAWSEFVRTDVFAIIDPVTGDYIKFGGSVFFKTLEDALPYLGGRNIVIKVEAWVDIQSNYVKERQCNDQ